MPALIDALKSEHAGLRYYAAGALGQIGSNAKAAVPALTDALEDDDKSWDVRKAAAKALRKISKSPKHRVPPADNLKNVEETNS